MKFVKSEEIQELVKALINAQNEFELLQKDKINPYFNSRYASLDSVHKATQKALRNNGLAIIQTFDMDDLVTTLVHVSGQHISGQIKMMTVKNDPQSVGSSITYYRRYCYCAMIGIVPDEDDDGNAEKEIKIKKTELGTKLTEENIEGFKLLGYDFDENDKINAAHMICKKLEWKNDVIKKKLNESLDKQNGK